MLLVLRFFWALTGLNRVPRASANPRKGLRRAIRVSWKSEQQIAVKCLVGGRGGGGGGWGRDKSEDQSFAHTQTSSDRPKTAQRAQNSTNLNGSLPVLSIPSAQRFKGII